MARVSGLTTVLAKIDADIARLQEIRTYLSTEAAVPTERPKRTRKPKTPGASKETAKTGTGF